MKFKWIFLFLWGVILLSLSLGFLPHPSSGIPAALPVIAQNSPDPEWYDIIQSAAQRVGISSIENWVDYGASGYDAAGLSGMVENFPVQNHDVVFMINEISIYQIYYRGEDEKYSKVDFHGISAILQNDNLDTNIHNGYCLYWEANGLYYGVCHNCLHQYQANTSYIFELADALYSAAGGVESSTAIIPTQVAQNDQCAGVTCQSEYCTDDGAQYLYDCVCDPSDGECYCRADACSNGCDAVQGGCLLVQEGLCAGVDCGPDYCTEDGRTRMHDCSCSPEDGGCYCYSEICEAGCNMATGKCVESLIITDEDSGEYTYTDSTDLLTLIGGVVVGGGALAGGGYLTVKTVLARRAVKEAAKAAANAAEPSLGELLDRVERSANRALDSVDKAESILRVDEQKYRDFLARNTRYDANWARHMNERAALIEKAEMGVKIIKKGADVSAELIGKVPGAGTPFQYGYNMLTTAAESAASGDSIGTVALKTTGKGLETFAGDKLFGKVKMMDDLPSGSLKRSLKQVVKEAGADNLFLESAKNEGLNHFMNGIKEVKSSTRIGKLEKTVEAAAKKVDRKFIGKTIRKVLYSR